MPRPARTEDLPGILALLAGAKLPTADVARHLDTFLVCEAGRAVVGIGGLELHGRVALLRSLAVAPAHEGRGLATALCDRLEAVARERGVADLYLLTETAERFFAKRGYARIPRTNAPPEIAACEELARLCPQSAALMHRTLTSLTGGTS